MRFLSIYKAVESNEPPTTEMMAAMGQLIEEMTNDGTLVATEGCLPSARGARVRRSGSKLSVTDGPFTESKELIAGFALLNADSKEHAIELTKKFLAVAGDGECEVRQIWSEDDFAADVPQEIREQEERNRAKLANR